MSYKNTLEAVDTEKALELVGIEFNTQGAYAKFACLNPDCQGIAVIKAYGDKKNLYYCPKCKSSGHIISLVMKKNGLDWNGSQELLMAKATGSSAKQITEELNIKYELQYHEFLKTKGLSEEICRFLEIGVPKGKTMLAGSVAFAVRDHAGMKVAYYGIKMKDGKPIFHRSFNPEFYLYNLCNINPLEVAYFTTDIFRCVQLIEEQKQCICNFGFPYLSPVQIKLMENLDKIVFMVEEPLVKDIAITLATKYRGFYRFEH